MIEYSEKRDFIRMPVQCPVYVRESASDIEETAELLDLSATGVRFVSQRALDTGARLELTVKPDHPITPPLEATISVIRCEEIDNGFDIAASIELVAPALYTDDN
jgi:hypothetical protein